MGCVDRHKLALSLSTYHYINLTQEIILLVQWLFFISRCNPQYLFQQQSSQFSVCVLQCLHLLDQIMSSRWKKKCRTVRAEHYLEQLPLFFFRLLKSISLHTHTSPSPCVDLQCGLQDLGPLLCAAGQLLGAEEVACSTHFKHSDHSWVGVQPRCQLGAKGENALCMVLLGWNIILIWQLKDMGHKKSVA